MFCTSSRGLSITVVAIIVFFATLSISTSRKYKEKASVFHLIMLIILRVYSDVKAADGSSTTQNVRQNAHMYKAYPSAVGGVNKGFLGNGQYAVFLRN